MGDWGLCVPAVGGDDRVLIVNWILGTFLGRRISDDREYLGLVSWTQIGVEDK